MDNKLLDSLRLYGGDTRVRKSDGQLGDKTRDDFYGDKEAYRTLNALLFDGTSNEYQRIKVEGHKLNVTFAKRIEETIQLYLNIFELMCIMQKGYNQEKTIIKRIERKATIKYFEQGYTPSFLSASKKGYDEDFAEKCEIILLEICVNSNTPCIDFEKCLLGIEYYYPDERETLIPPFAKIELNKLDLTAPEKRKYRDMNGNPPCGKYQISKIQLPDYRSSDSEVVLKNIFTEICQKKVLAISGIEAMNGGNWSFDFSEYIAWKDKLHLYLKVLLSEMWYRRE